MAAPAVEKDPRVLWDRLSTDAQRVGVVLSRFAKGHTENSLTSWFEEVQVDVPSALKELELQGIVKQARLVDVCRRLVEEGDIDAKIIVRLYDMDPPRYRQWEVSRLIIDPDLHNFVRHMDDGETVG